MATYNKLYFTSAYYFTFPSIASTTNDFTFSLTLGNKVYSVQCQWYNDTWHIFFTFPDASIRECSLQNDMYQWTGYHDYFLAWDGPSDTIGHDAIMDFTGALFIK